jgi:phosphoglycerate dehydrogenase-like enzyme
MGENMNQRKLVITYQIDQEHLQKIKDVIPDWQVIAVNDSTGSLAHIKDAEVIGGWKKEIEEYCLKEETPLRWIQNWGAGVDGLPLQDMKSKNILLTNASGVHAYPISETILALMLSLTRKIHTYVKNQGSKTWHHANMKLEMHEKTVGIIGIGAIGKETAKITKAFGMKVLGVRRSGQPDNHVDEMFTLDQLNEILPQCDYVVITLPLTSETRHLFGKEQFKLMKPSAFLINIGRGEIIVEDELIEALRNQRIAGAGLDVFTTEPLSEDSPLWEFENIIITPHTSGSTEHYDKRVIEDIFIPNLRDYINGKKPALNIVDFEKGY